MSAYHKLTPQDCLILNGVPHFLSSIERDQVTVTPCGEITATRTIDRTEFDALLKQPAVVYRPNHFAKPSLKRAGEPQVQDFASLSPQAKRIAHWRELYCKCFLEAEKAGEVRRYEDAVKPQLEALNLRVNRIEARRQLGHVRKRAGAKVEFLDRPSARTLLEWVRRYERSGRLTTGLVPISMLPRSGWSQCSGAAERLMKEAIDSYLSPARPTLDWVHRNIMRPSVERTNDMRAEKGQAPIKCPSRATLARRIAGLSKFDVHAARYGIAAASKKYGPVEQGIYANIPLERCEIDEWTVDLFTFDTIPDPQNSDVPKEHRLTICAMIDCATRCILGLSLGRRPTSSLALRCVRLALSDRSDLAHALGCQSTWHQTGHILEIFHDNGHAFVSSEFASAMADLCITTTTTPAGIPKLRARIERVFKRVITDVLPAFSGRSFSSPVERGDYPSEDMASLNDDELLEVLIRYIVDEYHLTPHMGLLGQTPFDAWAEKTQAQTILPPPTPDTMRLAFGIEAHYRLSNRGIVIAGIAYLDKALAEVFRNRGNVDLRIKFDPEDMTAISWYEAGVWRTVITQSRACHGVSFAE